MPSCKCAENNKCQGCFRLRFVCPPSFQFQKHLGRIPGCKSIGRTCCNTQAIGSSKAGEDQSLFGSVGILSPSDSSSQKTYTTLRIVFFSLYIISYTVYKDEQKERRTGIFLYDCILRCQHVLTV